MTNTTATAAPIAAPSLFCECPDPECMPLHHAPGTPCGCASLFDPDLDEKTPAARGAYLHPLGHDGTGLRGEAHIVRCDDCAVVLNSGHRYYADRSGYPGYGNLNLARALADHHNQKEH